MKKIILLIVVVFHALNICAQTSESSDEKSKYELFTSAYGAQIKFRDYKVDGIKSGWVGFGLASTVRIVWSDAGTGYFAKLEVTNSTQSPTAFVEEGDLVNIIAAVQKMQTEIDADLAENPDYFENKYVTPDGFTIGYWIDSSNKKSPLQWFYRLERGTSAYKIEIDKVLPILEDTLSKLREVKR